ncbi:MAG TPA: carboxypeptidase regulatory-like domain-containing protein, partial [Dehalococcoidia bacterium]|nr:carboxypeptidase regulatory-like domain-containing protein [Dehalococcoidia bacterium]
MPATPEPAESALSTPAPTPTASTQRVSGQVVDQRSGRPIEGATIESRGEVARTGADGTFEMVIPSTGVALSVRADGYDSLPLTAAGNLGRIELTPRSLAGRVLDADSGQPIAAAVIATGGRFVRSDASGNFDFGEAPPDV